MYKGKLGIGIISFDRVDYFQQMMKSLSENTELENTDFHLYQDGAVSKFYNKAVTKQEKIDKCVEIFKNSSLPSKHPHIRKENVSIAINQFEALDDLARHYEHVLILEDDVILSPHYLRMIRVLINQFKNVQDVFSVSLSFRRTCKEEEIPAFLDRVGYIRQHWWAECINSQRWKVIKPDFLRYYDLIKDIPYTDRGARSDKILKLFAELGFPTGITSQDAAKEAATIHNGLNRVNTYVNRGMYIGEHGMHFRPGTYKKYGFSDFVPYIFDSDKDITEFKM